MVEGRGNYLAGEFCGWGGMAWVYYYGCVSMGFKKERLEWIKTLKWAHLYVIR